MLLLENVKWLRLQLFSSNFEFGSVAISRHGSQGLFFAPLPNIIPHACLQMRALGKLLRLDSCAVICFEWLSGISNLRFAIRNAAELIGLPTDVACPPKPWHRRAALVIRQASRISIAQGGAKLCWPLDQFVGARAHWPFR